MCIRDRLMKFLHLSSEVQGEVVKKRGREVVVLGQHVSIDYRVRVKAFKCQEPDCHADYDRRERLEKHMRRVHGQPRLACPAEGCTRTFGSKRSVYRHRKTVHLKVKVVRAVAGSSTAQKASGDT